ncbi:GNAT family N-acetyltransferase [Guptibacillus hwajinpoensis]|uniref:GNAT family N-acetyltransferase n=1 Tax=Guptibacillus hwajinpoensis TaxID=208199 RepID=UPI0024B38709|nr:GNAT family N-acetyltransferase [Pseudalkalibacillus hwajinpoensis]
MEIKVDDLSGPEVAELLNDHIKSMQKHSPPESKHALDLEGLRKPEITFWSAWEAGDLVGCVALQELNNLHAEIKSMKTASAHLRKGVAKRLLQHTINEARARGYERLSLETGSMEVFQPARKLYASFRFHECQPFAGYREDPNSVFMSLELSD